MEAFPTGAERQARTHVHTVAASQQKSNLSGLRGGRYVRNTMIEAPDARLRIATLLGKKLHDG
jgi:hypothetical protein